MVFRHTLWILAALTTVAGAETPAPGTESPRTRAARYYAAGLEQPLMQLRRGALLLQTCTTRLRAACSKEQRALAAKNHTIVLLDELTLFPQRSAGNPADDVKRAAELKQRINATSDALLADANAYGRQLLIRYGAALDTCPGEYDAGTYGPSLDALTAVELRDFQRVAEPDYATVLATMGAARQQAAESLRKLPVEDCAAIVDLGQLLMEMMTSKLEPWTHVERHMADLYRSFDFNTPKAARIDPPPAGLAHSVAGNFITVVATELQLRVFPETAPRIKAIAEAEGIGPAG